MQTSSIGAFNTPGNEVILIQMQRAPREISDDQNHGRHLPDLATAGYYEIHEVSVRHSLRQTQGNYDCVLYII